MTCVICVLMDTLPCTMSTGVEAHVAKLRGWRSREKIELRGFDGIGLAELK